MCDDLRVSLQDSQPFLMSRPAVKNPTKVRQIISAPITDALPSQPLPGVWLWQTGPLDGLLPRSDRRTGKWMVFLSSSQADALWPVVKNAIKSGCLASIATAAKISLPNPSKLNSHVLIIYTFDYNDKKTVADCLSAIRRLGILVKLYYKTDDQTHSGIYSGGKETPWLYNSDMFETPTTLKVR